MLMDRHSAVLLIVDVQEKLVPAIYERETLIANCRWLAAVAERLQVPVVVTEHFPDKLGKTLPQLAEAAPSASYVAKTHFSATREGGLIHTAIAGAKQIVVCGMETHVCVLETAMELQDAGKQVFVAADACGSRQPLDRDLAYERMRANGLEIVTREMVLFEWLEKAGTDLFRQMSKDFLR